MSIARKKFTKIEDFFPNPSEDSVNIANFLEGELTKTDVSEEKKAQSIIDFLEKYKQKITPYYIAEFSCISSKLKTFFSENKDLNEYWVENLKKEKYHVTLVYPMDLLKPDSQKGFIKYIGIFEQYTANVLLGMSANLVDQAKDERSGASADELLDFACSMGSFQALVYRCQKNINDSGHDKEISLVQFDSDMHDLGFLYWETGYIHAADYALKMADVFLNHDVALSQHYRDQAAIKYLCAEYLHAVDNYSTYILEIMSGGRGLRAFFDEESQVDYQSSNPITSVVAAIFGKNENLPKYRQLALLEMQPFFPAAIAATGEIKAAEVKNTQEISHAKNQHGLLNKKTDSSESADPKKLTALLNQRPLSPKK